MAKLTIPLFLTRRRIDLDNPTPGEVLDWWLNGWGRLNLGLFAYVIVYTVALLFTANPWMGVLIFPTLAIAVLVNFLYMVGPSIEILTRFFLKRNVVFDRYAPRLKAFLLLCIIAIVVGWAVFSLAKAL